MNEPDGIVGRENAKLVAFLDELLAVRETLLHQHDWGSRKLDAGTPAKKSHE